MAEVETRQALPGGGRDGRDPGPPGLARALRWAARSSSARGKRPMSLYGSMFTAISGLSAQSSALSNVANNIANSQTTGYKRVDTSFSDYVTATSVPTASGVPISSSTVIASGSATNGVQGSIQQTDNALDLAVSGQGFFSVSSPISGTAADNMSFDPRSFYTRAGDFSLNKQGYLVNGQGYYLNGWSVDGSGAVNRTEISPIRVDQGVFDPVATSGISLSANLPNDAETGEVVNTQFQVYDRLGTQHSLAVAFTKTSGSSWSMAATNPGGTAGSANLGSITLNFTDGKLSSFSDATCIQDQIVDALNTVDRGVKANPKLFVLRYTAMPAVLVELGFISNESDEVLLTDRQDDFARAIARGVTDYEQTLA